MTHWQKSCIAALITSPTAFKLFREKTINKRQIDQYLNRVWPYKTDKVYASEQNSNNKDGKYFLLRLIEILKKAIEEKDNIRIEIDNKIQIKNVLNYLNPDGYKLFKPIGLPYGNNICNIILMGDGAGTRGIKIQGDRDINFFNELSNDLSRLNKVNSIVIDMYNSNVGKKEILNAIISHIYTSYPDLKIKKSLRGKKTRVYNALNVGIEIEYDGINCQKIEKLLLRNNAISFNSGWDGGYDDGALNFTSTLRENRLRINGQRGLSALYILLDEMKKRNCKITTNSGMHYHIDCTQGKRFEMQKEDFVIHFDEEVRKYLSIIFELSEKHTRYEFIKSINNYLRRSTEFNTYEWRFGTKTLNYSKITLQILCAVHCTKMITNKKSVNIKYLSGLADLYSKLIN